MYKLGELKHKSRLNAINAKEWSLMTSAVEETCFVQWKNDCYFKKADATSHTLYIAIKE